MGNSFKTFLKHTAKDFHNQSVNPPVVRASTIIFKSMQDIKKTQNKYLKDPVSGNFDYGRQGTSTTYALQQILKKIEECYKVYLTPTGFGAIFLGVLSVVKPDDEIIVTDSVYSPSRLLTETYLKKFNIRAIFYNPNDLNDLKSKITKKTKLIFVENPGSNTFEFQDLSKIVALAKKNKIYTAIDNTWGTPYFLKPIKLGFDMSIVSATKYYSGASGLLGFKIKSKNKDSVLKFVNSLKLFGYGFSWGGFESLALYQTHQALGKRQFTHINKDEHIIRMHIGLEDPKDIIDDIKQALKFIK